MKRTTSAHVDRWARRSLLVPVAMTVIAVSALTCERTVWQGSFTLQEDQEATSPEFALPAGLIGGVRVEARAELPVQRWAAYQLTLIDGGGTPLLELTKEAWHESGVWQEEGESGTWRESDTALAWDLRARAEEKVKLEVEVLETGFSYDVGSGSAPSTGDTQPAWAKISVPLQVAVRAGVTDGRLLALGVLFSAVFSLLAFYLSGHGGRPVIVEANDDSEVKGRASFGGPGRLVAVAIAGKVDETAPPRMRVRVILRDEAGTTLYDQSHASEVSFRKEDGEIEDGRFSEHLYFELPRATSWGVFVEVTPDQPMEHLKLIVRDGATTRRAVELESVGAAT